MQGCGWGKVIGTLGIGAPALVYVDALDENGEHTLFTDKVELRAAYPGLPVSEGIKIPEKLYGVKFGDLISFERDQWKLTVFSGDMWIVHGRARRCNHAVLPARESKTTRHRLAVNFRLGGSCTLDEEGNIKCFEEHVVEAAVGFAQLRP